MPYASYEESARVLDGPRLGKQRVEAYQVLLQLCGIKMIDYPKWEPRLGGWSHPALAMWAGHEFQLVEYISAMCNEWTSRGYSDTCLEKSRYAISIVRQSDWTEEPPAWIGNEELHMTHRSNLVWKDLEFYRDKFPEDVPENPYDESEYFEYIWPTTDYDMKRRKVDNFELAKMVYQRSI